MLLCLSVGTAGAQTASSQPVTTRTGPFSVTSALPIVQAAPNAFSVPVTTTVTTPDGKVRHKTIFQAGAPFALATPNYAPKPPQQPPVVTAVFDPSCSYVPFYGTEAFPTPYLTDDGCGASSTSLGVVGNLPNRSQFLAQWDFNLTSPNIGQALPTGALPMATVTDQIAFAVQLISNCPPESGAIGVEWSSFPITGPDPSQGAKLSLGFGVNANVYLAAVSETEPSIVAQWNVFPTDVSAIYYPSQGFVCPGTDIPFDPDPGDPGDGGGGEAKPTTTAPKQ